MPADTLERFLRCRRETRRRYYRTPQLVADFLEPRRMIHRRTNHREIEPRRRANISVTDVAKMQREPEMYLGIAGGVALQISRGYFFGGSPRGSESGSASLSRIFGRAQLENRQHPVAHELERLAAFRCNCINHRFEVVVEHRDYALARHRVGQRREASQIAKPDHRANRLAATARDRAREHPLP